MELPLTQHRQVPKAQRNPGSCSIHSHMICFCDPPAARLPHRLRSIRCLLSSVSLCLPSSLLRVVTRRARMNADQMDFQGESLVPPSMGYPPRLNAPTSQVSGHDLRGLLRLRVSSDETRLLSSLKKATMGCCCFVTQCIGKAFVPSDALYARYLHVICPICRVDPGLSPPWRIPYAHVAQQLIVASF